MTEKNTKPYLDQFTRQISDLTFNIHGIPYHPGELTKETRLSCVFELNPGQTDTPTPRAILKVSMHTIDFPIPEAMNTTELPQVFEITPTYHDDSAITTWKSTDSSIPNFSAEYQIGDQYTKRDSPISENPFNGIRALKEYVFLMQKARKEIEKKNSHLLRHLPFFHGIYLIRNIYPNVPDKDKAFYHVAIAQEELSTTTLRKKITDIREQFDPNNYIATYNTISSLLEDMEKIAELVHEINAIGIIHRDIRPMNITYRQETRENGESTPVLFDFNTALFKDHTAVPGFGGMRGITTSPEEIQKPTLPSGSRTITDKYSDQFSLAATIGLILSLQTQKTFQAFDEEKDLQTYINIEHLKKIILAYSKTTNSQDLEVFVEFLSNATHWKKDMRYKDTRLMTKIISDIYKSLDKTTDSHSLTQQLVLILAKYANTARKTVPDQEEKNRIATELKELFENTNLAKKEFIHRYITPFFDHVPNQKEKPSSAIEELLQLLEKPVIDQEP